ncbi:DinB family protein [Pontibacter ruber]|uniref:DinB family protein n=1 Tax=Pontibacter ruber TaxID=1343895 RepID=A0ABW5CV16_9BACT|nr:DinB family protein [Pontibacter ruber]
METVFKAWATSRKLYLNFFDNYSLEQLNKIPDGFNNNLIWNIGHIIVAQQALIYKGSNLPMYISDNLVNLYQPGTKPTGPTSQTQVNELKELLISLIATTKSDFQKGIFNTYTERTTATGFHLASLSDAFEFNNYHEGLHLGYMMGLSRLI